MFYKITLIFGLAASIFIFSSCEEEVNYKSLPVFTSQGVLAVVEIPAGTNKKIEYKKSTDRFEVDVKNGVTQGYDFLPYPANYGFVPSTFQKNDEGKEEALGVLIISESLQTGDTISVIPIGALLLKDGKKRITKIIAVPADTSKRTMQVSDYQTFVVKYSMAKNIIETWFLNYKGLGKMELIGWRNDRFALQEIKRQQAPR